MKTSLAILAIGLFGTVTLLHAADEKAAYPLTTCLVSGEKLGEMGKPYVFSYEGKDIELCCKNCKKEFDKDPAKFMKAYDEAAKKSAQ